jgi:hypothetical protein
MLNNKKCSKCLFSTEQNNVVINENNLCALCSEHNSINKHKNKTIELENKLLFNNAIKKIKSGTNSKYSVVVSFKD